MELWKVEKYCETASLHALREIAQRLDQLIDKGQLTGTNAWVALQKVREAILLREMFGEH